MRKIVLLTLLGVILLSSSDAIKLNKDKKKKVEEAEEEEEGGDKEDEEDKSDKKSGNVYDRYKPFEIKTDFDEEPFIHQFRHASAIERALNSNATTQQEKDIYTWMTDSQKEYSLDWKHVEGPQDYETPVYYRGHEFDNRNKTREKIEKEQEKKEEAKKKEAIGPYPEVADLKIPDSLRQELVKKALKKKMKKKRHAKEQAENDKAANAGNQKAPFEEKDKAFVQIASEFMPDSNQLSWKEFQDDKNYPDQMEWDDVDFEFRKTHPDWGADDNVKAYFRKAQQIKYKKVEMENDYEPFVNKYVSVQRNATKKLERQERYEDTEYDRAKAKEALGSNQTADSDSETEAKSDESSTKESKKDSNKEEKKEEAESESEEGSKEEKKEESKKKDKKEKKKDKESKKEKKEEKAAEEKKGENKAEEPVAEEKKEKEEKPAEKSKEAKKK